jgi:hypothetical protein
MTCWVPGCSRVRAMGYAMCRAHTLEAIAQAFAHPKASRPSSPLSATGSPTAARDAAVPVGVHGQRRQAKADDGPTRFGGPVPGAGTPSPA